MSAVFLLSAFGDEIALDLETQLAVLSELRIRNLELRSVWGKNVLDLDDEELRTIRRRTIEAGVTVSCIGSPIGKSRLDDPIEREIAHLEQIFRVAEAIGTRAVRVFSFYPPQGSTNIPYDDYVPDASARLRQLVDLARREEVTLLLENEKEVIGDTPQRCHRILTAIDSPFLEFIWDPANFIQVGVERPVTEGWPLLAPHVAHVHIKDARLDDGAVRAAGEGDGQIPNLLAALRERGYRGVLALEPHLASASRRGGFSGTVGMAYAVQVLRQLMARLGCAEMWE